MFTLVRGLFALGGSGLLVGFGLSSVGLGPFSGATGDSEQPPNPSASRPEPDPPSGALPLASQDPEPDEPETPDANSDDSTPRIQVFTCPPSTEGATIEYLVPNGQRVEKGDIICRLDQSVLRRQLAEREIETSRAEAEYQVATHSLERAQINLDEYSNGIYPKQLKTLRHAIDIAGEELKLASLKYQQAQERHEKSVIDEIGLQQARLEESRAQATYEKALKEQEVLQDYSHKYHNKRLEIAVESARTKMLQWKSIYSKTAELENTVRDAIEKSVFQAPFDGVVEYAQDIHAGARVPGGRAILRIVPLDEAENEEGQKEQPRAEELR